MLVLKDKHWIPVASQCEFKMLPFAFKALERLGSGFLECLQPYEDAGGRVI